MLCPNCDAEMEEDVEEGVWRCPECDHEEWRDLTGPLPPSQG